MQSHVKEYQKRRSGYNSSLNGETKELVESARNAQAREQLSLHFAVPVQRINSIK